MPHRSRRDPFYHRNTINTKIVSIVSILPRLTRKLYNRCIAVQCQLVKNLIVEYYATKEVCCILAVCPNVVWKVILEELLDKEGVIYELIVDRVNKDEYRFCTCNLPHGSYYSITCERDDILEDGRPLTPNF
jgi:hypothetical protein